MGISQSMSRAGTPYDSAPMGRYYNTLKAEEVYQHRYDTIEELDQAINDFAYVWYNQIRLHSYNNYLTPLEKRLKQFYLGNGVTKMLDQDRTTTTIT
ncbi:transposase [Streptococcus thermophilus]|nr:transposase [Streptococcus thermophilus]